MKIPFPDKSYIEIIKSPSPGKILITIAAKDHSNALATIANSVELTIEQFQELTKLDQ
jgi:hypothetical protein